MTPATTNDLTATQPEPSAKGGSGSGGQRNSSHAGESGRANVKRGTDTGNEKSTDNSDESVDKTDEGVGSAGSSSLTDPPLENEDPANQSCELNDTCTSKCQNSTVTCGVESVGFACEFEGFTGATAQVACGQRLVIGTACCGGCGCVPVELLFDGTHCWQGVPQCNLPEFNNRLFDPHPTTTPNPSFVPPSNFYLGSAGSGGSEARAGSGGLGGSEAGGGSGGVAQPASSGAGGNSGGTGGSPETGGAPQATGGAPVLPAAGAAGAPDFIAGASGTPTSAGAP